MNQYVYLSTCFDIRFSGKCFNDVLPFSKLNENEFNALFEHHVSFTLSKNLFDVFSQRYFNPLEWHNLPAVSDETVKCSYIFPTM